LPDYDGDGDVSCDEAHAYALLTSTSVDISVKTSDAFLRAFSRTGKGGEKNNQANGGSAKAKKARKARPPLERSEDAQRRRETAPAELLTADTPFDQLLAVAAPPDQAVLSGLSAELGLDQPRRSKEAKNRAADLMKEKKKLEGRYRKKSGEYFRLAGQIRRVLTNRWPELSNRWHPAVSKLLSDEADAVVQLIESHPRYARLEQLRGEIEELSEDRLELDRQWAKCQRLIRTLENVALAANLPRVAPSDVQRQYRELLAAESASFGPQKPSQ
jgi:hypothetical protein